MIEAKELRIGNYVKTDLKDSDFDNNIYQIETIANEFPTLNTIEFGIGVIDWNNIKPIPLTEEWLVKFGFVKRFDSFLLRHKNGVISTYLSDNSVGLYDSEHSYNIGFGLNMGELRVKHIHQLQNLYFALTNEELKITE